MKPLAAFLALCVVTLEYHLLRVPGPPAPPTIPAPMEAADHQCYYLSTPTIGVRAFGATRCGVYTNIGWQFWTVGGEGQHP